MHGVALPHQGRSCPAVAWHGDSAMRKTRRWLLLQRTAAAVLLAACGVEAPIDDLYGERPCACACCPVTCPSSRCICMAHEVITGRSMHSTRPGSTARIWPSMAPPLKPPYSTTLISCCVAPFGCDVEAA